MLPLIPQFVVDQLDGELERHRVEAEARLGADVSEEIWMAQVDSYASRLSALLDAYIVEQFKDALERGACLHRLVAALDNVAKHLAEQQQTAGAVLFMWHDHLENHSDDDDCDQEDGE